MIFISHVTTALLTAASSLQAAHATEAGQRGNNSKLSPLSVFATARIFTVLAVHVDNVISSGRWLFFFSSLLSLPKG